MKPGLLGVFITSSNEDGEERTCVLKAAEHLSEEYPGYEISALFLRPQGAKNETEKEAYARSLREMEQSNFEILVVNGAPVSNEMHDLFRAVPPDVEVVNNTLWMSDLDRELQGRFRSQNCSAIALTHRLAQALA